MSPAAAICPPQSSVLPAWKPASRRQVVQDSHPPGLWPRGGDLPRCSPLVPDTGLPCHPWDKWQQLGSAKPAPLVSVVLGRCQAEPGPRCQVSSSSCTHHCPLTEFSSQNTKPRATLTFETCQVCVLGGFSFFVILFCFLLLFIMRRDLTM